MASEKTAAETARAMSRAAATEAQCTPAEPWHVEESRARVRLGDRVPRYLQAVSGVEDAAQKRERTDHELRDLA